MAGTLTDTYVAAIQHDLVDLPEGARRVGVVRKPTPWFHGVVDENRPALGPPRDLLAAFQEREEGFKLDGMCDEGAHNAAWEELDFAERYREHLRSDEARTALAALRDALADGTDIALVCYENTDKKRCHRTILRDVLAGSDD
ncbi:Uncharacterized conserved protein YeaO, DUF488 family [Halomicrobium zhouii]|uniref:Uncharacterized conserved protein YeaO, DUF488 family n=1 Tax=Halomicrobium zhouii TaxID=767519 RepID=A0A1I6KRA1_9EURY|nr:DUF488 family protein [Halomicrobium zhouii]SFR93440.1 Uncharacterized conserved protein YeaO, DUF488 family [Halomicrobium zhouii]